MPFQLGMDYEHWEFDLDFLEDLHICEKYKYIRNDILEVLGNPIETIYLFFNCDVLVRVDVEFQCNGVPMTFINLVASLENKYGKQELSTNIKKSIIQKTWNCNEKTISIQQNFKSNTIKLVITKKRYLTL